MHDSLQNRSFSFWNMLQYQNVELQNLKNFYAVFKKIAYQNF